MIDLIVTILRHASMKTRSDDSYMKDGFYDWFRPGQTGVYSIALFIVYTFKRQNWRLFGVYIVHCKQRMTKIKNTICKLKCYSTVCMRLYVCMYINTAIAGGYGSKTSVTTQNWPPLYGQCCMVKKTYPWHRAKTATNRHRYHAAAVTIATRHSCWPQHRACVKST